jgi:formate dehydrogenase major subunit
MDLVKLEIDGKRVIADNAQTILEVARQHGIADIPTLCHDGQLEPFASCFLCVVKVKGARTLLPACSTKVQAGMVVETDSPEVRRSRKAALELMLSNHYADCVGPCQLKCPAGIDIQGYIALAALGKYDDAIKLIKEANPLPAVCGRVCTRPCEVKGCRRNLLDEAVGIDYIKRYVADLDLGSAQPWRPDLAPANGKRVAVVGGGPAGLSAAYYLAISGHAVTIFESLPEAGGMLRYGIPEYRLPKDVLDLEIGQILALGVELSTNVTLGKDFTVTSLRQDGYDAVFLGIGAWDTSKMRVENEDVPGVLPGIAFLREYGLHRAHQLPGRVLVVGGGNTAIDCARTSLRLGADEVRLLYRRTRKEMPANEVEIEDADHEGVNLDFLVAPTGVIVKDGRAAGLECLRMELGAPDASGRRSPQPVRGSEFTVEADWIIAAIGQSTQAQAIFGKGATNMLPVGETLNLTRWQTIQVNDKTFETTVDGVFSGGDVVTGAATAIEAIAAGRKAAYAINAYIQTGKAQAEPVEFLSRKDSFRQVTTEDLRDGPRHARQAMPMVNIEERVRSFVEVEKGYTTADLNLEVARCLECGCTALFDCDLRRYATEYQVDIANFLGEAKQYRVDRRHPLIELDPNKCILCGRCVRICSELVGVAAYGFINRGFNTVVKPALAGALLDTECVSCGLCIDTCPTGAIEEIVQLIKPGPWDTQKTPTVCVYCGVGCKLDHETHGEALVKVSGRDDGAATAGNHCRKGRFGYAYVRDAERLLDARVRDGNELKAMPLEDAISHTAAQLKDLRGKCSASEIAVFVSPRLTNEEIYLAQKLARVALGTHQVASLANLVNRELDCPDVVATATYRDLENAQAIVVVGSRTCDEHFVADLMIKKAAGKGGRLIYIGPDANRTSQYADVFLQCPAGAEPDVLAALLAAGVGVDADLAAAASILAGSERKVLVTNRDHRGPRRAGDVRFYAEAAAAMGGGLLVLHEKANMQGLLDMGASPAWFPGYAATDDPAVVAEFGKEWRVALHETEGARADLAAKLRDKAIKVAVVIGEDPMGAPDFPADLSLGLGAADFLVVMDLFLTDTAKCADIVLPLSGVAETSGTLTNSERRVQAVQQAVLPATGLENWQVLCQIAGQMGDRFKMTYDSPADVLAEIKRVVPAYAGVVVDSPEADGTWNAALAPLTRRVYSSAEAVTVTPVPTLALDHLELRYQVWFDAIMAKAREKLEAEKAATPV